MKIGINLKNVKDVSCGIFHTLVLLENGEVSASGGNSFGQLGVGNKESSSVFIKIPSLSDKNVVQVSAGQHSGCITSNGDL